MYLFDVINEKVIEEYVPIKEKKKSPFDYINSINEKNNLRDDLVSYSQFMINRGFSQYRELLYFSNEINRYSIDNVLHYDAYFHFVTKKKRFAKWGKSELDENKISSIIEYYNISRRKAIDVMDLVDYEVIQNGLFKGGKK